MNLTVRPITEGEAQAFRQQISRGFGGDLREEDLTHFLEVFEIPRTIAAFDDDALIGTCAAFTFDVTVPGGTLPMGGTTIVTVSPTHRRKGVLRAMMRSHLDEIRGRGEPLAGLWASETTIYGRFGFGLAVESCETRIDANTIGFLGDAPPGSCRFVEPGEAESLLPAVYDRVRVTRPGMLTRHADWWKWKFFYDPEHDRKGASARRFVVYEGPDGVDGYAIYRQTEKWGDFPEGEVKVTEVVAATTDAHTALWRYLLRIDLFPKVVYWNLAPDDELPWRVTEHRRVRRAPTDSLWLRLMDIPRALSERAYDTPGRLVIGVTDPFLPDNDGAYELEAGTDGGRCVRTDASPDLTMGVDTLAALYFGANRASVLARAGLVEGSQAALATADRIFAWPVAPWCTQVF